MKWFKKKTENKNTAVPETKVEALTSRVFGKPRKNKNTYVCVFEGLMCDLDLFDMCKRTPMPVVIVNGEKQQDSSGFMKCTEFPNPGASVMCHAYPQLKPFMGAKLASTIVEYNSKEDGKPVLTLFPQNQIFFHNLGKTATIRVEKDDKRINCILSHTDMTEEGLDEFKKLNGPSKKDLVFQVEKRQRFIQEFNKSRTR